MTTKEKTRVFDNYAGVVRLWCIHKKAGNKELAEQADLFGKMLAEMLEATADRVKLEQIRKTVFKQYKMAEFFGVANTF